MITDTEFAQKRHQLKCRLDAGEYKTLVDVILDGTSRLIQKLTRGSKRRSFLYGGVVIALITLLLSFLTSLLIGETNPIRWEMAAFELSVVLFVLMAMLVSKISIRSTFATINDNLLDVIESDTDLTNLQLWLTTACNKTRHLLFSLTWGILQGFYSSIVISMIKGGFVGFGPTFVFVVTSVQLGMFIYYVLLYLALAVRLRGYQLKLYKANPSSSEIIDHLSDMFSVYVFVVAIVTALGTLIAAVFGLLNTINAAFLILALWGPLTVLFVVSQYSLSKIIVRAKWKTLNEIQAQVEELQKEGNLTEKETMDAVKRLTDYHDSIKATRNSALDFRAGLNYANSLLLPLIAFALGNFDKVLGFFS